MNGVEKDFPKPEPVKGKVCRLLDETAKEAGFNFETGRCTLVSQVGGEIHGWQGDDKTVGKSKV